MAAASERRTRGKLARLGRRLLAGGLLLVVILACLVATAPYVVSGPWLGSYLAAQASAQLEGTVTIRAARWRWPLVLTLHEVRVRAPSGAEVLWVPRVHIEAALLPLLRRRLEVRRLELSAPRVDLATQDDGERLALERAFSPRRVPEPAEPAGGGRPVELQVKLGRLRVDGLELRQAWIQGELGPADLAVDELSVVAGESIELTVGSLRLGLDGDVVRAALSAEGAVELGPAGEVSGWLRLAGEGLSYSGVDLSRVDAVLWLRGRELELAPLAVLAGEAAATVVGRVDLGAPLERHDLALVAHEVPLASWLGALEVTEPRYLPQALTGTVALRGLEGGSSAIEADLSGTGIEFLGGLGRDLSLAGTGQLDLTGLRHLAVRAESSGLALSGHGELPFSSQGALDLRLELEAHDAAALSRLAGVPLTLERARLAGRVQGSFEEPLARADLAVDGLRLRGLPGLDLLAEASLRGDRIHLQRVALLPEPGGRVELRGELRLPSPALPEGRLASEVRLEDVQPGPWAGVPELLGAFSGRGRVEGSWSAPRLRLELESRGLVYNGVRLAPVHAALAAEPGRLEVSRLDAQVEGGGEITARGTYAGSELALEAEVTALPLTLAEAVLGPTHPTSGLADAQLTLQGPIAAPVGKVKLEVRDLAFQAVPLGVARLEAQLAAGWAEGRLDLDGPTGRLGAAGRYELASRRLELVASAEGIALEPVAALVELPVTAGGHAQLAVRLDGRLPEPEVVEARLQIDGATLDEVPVEGPLILGLSRQSGPYQVSAELPGLSLAGTVTTSPLAVDLGGEAVGLALDRFLPQLAELGVGAVTSGRVELSLGAAGLAGSLRLTRLDLSAQGRTMRAVEPVVIRLERGVAHVDRLRLAGAEGARLSLAGTAGRELDLEARGDVHLAWIAAFVPSVASAEGVLSLSLAVEGPATRPSFHGVVDVAERLRLRVRGLDRDLVVRAAHLEASSTGEGRGEVRGTAEGALDGGEFSLEGFAALEGFSPRRYDVALNADNLALRAGTVTFESNARLRLAGDGGQAAITGRVDVVRGRYVKKFELREFNFIAADRPARAAQLPPWLERLSLDVIATSTEGLEVQVDAGVLSLELVLGADLQITGTAARPFVEGRLQASRGRLAFPRAQLDVEQAVIELPGGPVDDLGAEVQLRAEGEVTPEAVGEQAPPTYFVTLSLEGDLSQMALELTADPGLTRLEVLSLLVTGQASLTQLAGDGSDDAGTLDAALAFAGAQLTGPLAEFAEEQLERALNLRLQLGAELTREGLRLTARKDVTRRLQLEGAYLRTIGGTGSMTSARARVLLTNRLFLEGTAASVAGEQAFSRAASERRLELKWRLYGY